ncbi:LolA family protein [Sphingomonas jatrophae]|uniref:Outer membrane lipoprotein-sorting protein n=1 Tax=Sphingomonas jatrophae TaxID=1166337 RepID=A0A1I6LN34_9SPHN|nr:outer membrane lipoprotein carrier protein LolA [Sphingomonas jatrophae]SFS04819.1 Outer membrane lipoprotein-sorting protein [Sphingomonas jatrophae]
MFRAIALAPIALVAAAPLAAAPAPLDQVSQHLRAVTSMTANFTQTDRTGKALTGTLSLKRPGKVRFQYQPGVPLLIVGDGSRLTMIDYSVKQVSSWPVGGSPLGVLLDPSKDLTRFAKVVPGAPDELLVEARDPKHPEFGVTTLAFQRNAGAPAGLSLQGWITRDAQGNRSSVMLTNQRFNVPVSDGTFRWRDPRPRGRTG